jgi:hypothetical protein
MNPNNLKLNPTGADEYVSLMLGLSKGRAFLKVPA